MKIIAQFPNAQLQFVVYLGLSLVIIGFTAVLYSRSPTIFQPYFGRINPLVAVIIISLLGLILLSFLLFRGWFMIIQAEDLRGLLVALAVGLLFGVVIILFDMKFPFPPDINQQPPESLLFYPTAGYAVDIIFHVLPLSVLLLISSAVFRKSGFEGVVWLCILVVALIEPVYQTVFAASRGYTFWFSAFVALHIFLINLSQLLIFKRYDFISMYSMRLVYYLVWHVTWGWLRLRLLF